MMGLRAMVGTGSDVIGSWSFSAFSVLIYDAITNWAALRLPGQKRLYPRVFAWFGLVACLALSFWIDRGVWFIGLARLAVGLVWHLVAQRMANPDRRGGGG
jgi:basic amino acid/polyamine antiporter, APA family